MGSIHFFLDNDHHHPACRIHFEQRLPQKQPLFSVLSSLGPVYFHSVQIGVRRISSFQILSPIVIPSNDPSIFAYATNLGIFYFRVR